LLASGELPARFFRIDQYPDSLVAGSPKAVSTETVSRLTSRTGTLPSREYPGESRGIYSVLSNGSILAIEIGP